jgi:hypothetical protein
MPTNMHKMYSDQRTSRDNKVPFTCTDSFVAECSSNSDLYIFTTLYIIIPYRWLSSLTEIYETNSTANAGHNIDIHRSTQTLTVCQELIYYSWIKR